MRDVTNRKRFGFDDTFTHQVGHRHLGGRDQVERRLIRRLELIVFEFRQLPGAEQSVCMHKIRHINFGITMFSRMGIQHELDQCALHTGQRPLHRRKARSGDLCSGIEIKHAECLAEVHVIPGLEIKSPRLPPGLHLCIVGFVNARRNIVMQHIGQAEFDVTQR